MANFSVCRAFWSFWAPKGHDITTTKRIYDCRLRVSCIKEYKRLFNVLSVLKRYSPYSLQVNPFSPFQNLKTKKERASMPAPDVMVCNIYYLLSNFTLRTTLPSFSTTRTYVPFAPRATCTVSPAAIVTALPATFWPAAVYTPTV